MNTRSLNTTPTQFRLQRHGVGRGTGGKRGRTVRAWRRGRHRGASCRRGARRRRWCATRTGFAPTDINCVNSPTFARATTIAGHSPAKPATCGHEWQVDDSRDEALRIAAPRLTTREGTAPISGDCTVIAPRDEVFPPAARMS